VNNNGSVSCYFYDAAGERTVKLTSETEMVHVNGKKVGGNDAVTKFTAYVSPYFVVSHADYRDVDLLLHEVRYDYKCKRNTFKYRYCASGGASHSWKNTYLRRKGLKK
jgi:hypothetical protein